MMRILEPLAAASITAIAAHPDDIESWCGGTPARASQTPAPAALPESWRRRFVDVGRPAGLALAEAFMVLQLE